MQFNIKISGNNFVLVKKTPQLQKLLLDVSKIQPNLYITHFYKILIPVEDGFMEILPSVTIYC